MRSQRIGRRVTDQLPTLALWPGLVEPTNNACERALRRAVVQRRITTAMAPCGSAQGDAHIRTVIDTAQLKPGVNRFQTILNVVAA